MNLTDEEIRIKVAESLGAKWHSVLTTPKIERLVLAFRQWTDLGANRWDLPDGRVLSHDVPAMNTPPEKKIILPNNCLGISIMLIVVMLVLTVPFVVTFWLVGMFAPWWVSAPCGVAASVMLTLKWVKFK